MTENLRNLRIFKKIHEMPGIDGITYPAIQKIYFDSFAKKLRKISCKTLHRKPI